MRVFCALLVELALTAFVSRISFVVADVKGCCCGCEGREPIAMTVSRLLSKLSKIYLVSWGRYPRLSAVERMT
jgi:hypothetical protein